MVKNQNLLYWQIPAIGEPPSNISETRKRFVLKLMVIETPACDVVDAAKRVVRNRDKVCVDCGSNEQMEVHHLIPVDVNPFMKANIDNMVLVCFKCHRKRHREMRAIK